MLNIIFMIAIIMMNTISIKNKEKKENLEKFKN